MPRPSLRTVVAGTAVAVVVVLGPVAAALEDDGATPEPTPTVEPTEVEPTEPVPTEVPEVVEPTDEVEPVEGEEGDGPHGHAYGRAEREPGTGLARGREKHADDDAPGRSEEAGQGRGHLRHHEDGGAAGHTHEDGSTKPVPVSPDEDEPATTD